MFFVHPESVMDASRLDKRTLKAAKRALGRLNPKKLHSHAYVDPAGAMCARGALYVAENTRRSAKRLEPEDIGDAYGGRYLDGINRYLLDAKHYDAYTIDVLEEVNQNAWRYGAFVIAGFKWEYWPLDAISRARYDVVYAWVCKMLEKKGAHRQWRSKARAHV